MHISRSLASTLANNRRTGKTYALIQMLRDVDGVLIVPTVDIAKSIERDWEHMRGKVYPMTIELHGLPNDKPMFLDIDMALVPLIDEHGSMKTKLAAIKRMLE